MNSIDSVFNFLKEEVPRADRRIHEQDEPEITRKEGHGLLGLEVGLKSTHDAGLDLKSTLDPDVVPSVLPVDGADICLEGTIDAVLPLDHRACIDGADDPVTPNNQKPELNQNAIHVSCGDFLASDFRLGSPRTANSIEIAVMCTASFDP